MIFDVVKINDFLKLKHSIAINCKHYYQPIHKTKKASTVVEASVRVIGLEPTRLAAPDPKSGTSTNFAIPATNVSANINITSNFQRKIFKKNQKHFLYFWFLSKLNQWTT